MADEITTALSTLGGLRVASRSSAMRWRDKGLDVAELGERLNVQSILEGSVRMAGDRVRVTAQLTNVADRYQLWAERYDRDLEDVFAIQDEIGRAIAQTLRIKLIGEERPLVRRGTDNIEAYNLYLKGRYYWERRNPMLMCTALEQFERAVALDPRYALAHTGIADCLYTMAVYAVRRPRDVAALAHAAAQRALELDPELPEAHHTLGMTQFLLNLDWRAALHGHDEALRRNPDAAIFHIFRGIVLAWTKRPVESLAAAERALQLEPDSPLILYIAGAIYNDAKRPDEALRLANRALGLEPLAIFAHQGRTSALLQLHRYDEAVAAIEGAINSTERTPFLLAVLGRVYAHAGRTADAERVIDELIDQASHRYVSPLNIAGIYVALNRRDTACDWIERAYEEREPFLLRLATLQYDCLREEPRFRAVLRKLNLPE